MARATDPDIRLLRGAADPSRLAILRRLQCGGSVAACDFDCCDVRQPTVSHHLRVLREAGWVRTERRASRVYYSLETGAAERFRAIAGELLPSPAVRRRRRGEPVAEERAAGTSADGPGSMA
jgi:DNA-binding transcriptional ArsR family regulator